MIVLSSGLIGVVEMLYVVADCSGDENVAYHPNQGG